LRNAGVSTIWLQYWIASCASPVCCAGPKAPSFSIEGSACLTSV
jgi:hypothetical protein